MTPWSSSQAVAVRPARAPSRWPRRSARSAPSAWASYTRAGAALAEAVDVGIEVEGEDEALSPFALLLSLQLFTYWLAVKRGCNPDLAHRDDPRHVKAATHFEM